MSRSLDVEIMKFGGGSVANKEAVLRATGIVKECKSGAVIVVSARGGISDVLHSAASRAATGDGGEIDFAVREFKRRNLDLVEAVIKDPLHASKLRLAIESSSDEFRTVCQSLAVLRGITTQMVDLLVARAEIISAMIFASRLNEEGLGAVMLDPKDLIFVQKKFSNLVHDAEKCNQASINLIVPLLNQEKIVIVPGLIATGQDGELLTLGVGGSDYTATILAQALKAKQITLFKDVDGFLTADPCLVPNARIIPELNFREATELAYYGASVLHPRTLIPLLKLNIPLTIKNSRSPQFSGTRISDESFGQDFPVKALTAMRGQSLVTVAGTGMIGVPGIAGKTFSTLASLGISVSVITQASSESSICFIIPETEAESARHGLNEAFTFERNAKLVDDAKVDKSVAVLAIVGLGMKGTPGIAARVFSALSRKKINILAIAQGSSELNISVVISDKDVSQALCELHGEFRLEKLKPLPERVEKHVDLVVLGSGQIGRTFIRQSVDQRSNLKNQLGIEIGCISVIDRSGPRINMKGFSDKELLKLTEEKASGAKLRQSGDVDPMTSIRLELFTHAVAKGILVDLTASDSYDTIMEFIEQGYHVVLANKRPLTTSMEKYEAMLHRAKSKGVAVLHEATVGAGLPVLDTIAKLQASGDQILTVLGCLSGTLGYISTALSAGKVFSEAVTEAWKLGYTEPHPADDLSGMDVARKALILARKLGLRLNLEDIEVSPLFPKELYRGDPQEFLAALKSIDQEMAMGIRTAAEQGNVLRYVARIEGHKVSVGKEYVPENSPLGRLQGTDNQIVIRTKRYHTNPLIVTGPGAGAEVTAAGVVNDVVAIAVSHFGN